MYRNAVTVTFWIDAVTEDEAVEMVMGELNNKYDWYVTHAECVGDQAEEDNNAIQG